MVFGFVRSRFLSGVALATAVVLVFSGFSAVDAGASVVAEPVDVLSASSSESFERSDSVSARVTARAVGRRVEDVSQRSAVEQVFANPDGSWTSEVSVLPRFRADGGGGFVPIEESGGVDEGSGVFRGATADLEVADGTGAVGDGPTDGSVPLVTMTSTTSEDDRGEGKRGGEPVRSLVLGWEGALPVPVVEDEQVLFDEGVSVPVVEDPALNGGSFDDAATGSGSAKATATGSGTAAGSVSTPSTAASVPLVGAEVVVEATRSGFSHRVVLDRAPPAGGGVVLRFPLGVSDGLSVVRDEASGRLLIKDAEGVVVFSAAAPLVWDAVVDEASGLPRNQEYIDTDVVVESGVPVLVLRVSGEWLGAAERVFPVTIDPTWSAGAVDTYVQSGNVTPKGDDQELRVGTFDGGVTKARSLLRFATSSLTGKSITKAELRMTNHYSFSCVASGTKVQRLTSAFDPATVMWADQPTATSTGEGKITDSLGYSASCPGGFVRFPVTPIVQHWADYPSQNYGLRLLGEVETSNSSWKRYRSENFVRGGPDPAEPLLSVTYNSFPDMASVVSFNTGESVKDAAGKLWVRSKTPTFRSTVSDPDGGTVRAEFDLSGTSSLSKQAGSTVASKQVSTYQASLVENGSYTVTAWAHDGVLRSKAAGVSTTFTVDSVAPVAPVISSSGGVTNNGWLPARPGSNTFTFSSSADTDSFLYQFNNDAFKSVSAVAGRASVAWNPSGANVLRVKAVDKATNVSAVTTWTFGNGVASLTAPVGGSTSSDSFRVTGQGPSSLTGVVTPRVYWREANSLSSDGSTYGSSSGWYEAAVLPGIATGQPVVVDTSVSVAASPAGVLKGLGKDRLAALVELQVCFEYAGAPAASRVQCTTNESKKPVQVTKLPHAFGGSFPVATAGDGQVALTTGEMNLSVTDVQVDAGNTGLSLSRSYSSYSGIGANSKIFGRGWRVSLDGPDEGVSGVLVVESTQVDGTITLVGDDESAAVFRQPGNGRVALKAGEYVAANEDASSSGLKVELTGTGDAARVRVTEADGTVTTFKRGSMMEGNSKIFEWVTESVTGPHLVGATRFVSNAAGQTTMVIAGTETPLSCDTVTPVKGCRRLNLGYDAAGKITSVTFTAWDPDTNNMNTVDIVRYSYDGAGVDARLVSVTDARTGDVNSYTYGADSAAGVPLLASVEEKTSAGARVVAPTYYGYGLGNTGSGRSDWLEKVERGNPSTGDDRVQVARFVYGVNPVADGVNLPDLREERVKRWEQHDAKRPVTGYAVFGAGRTITTSRAGEVPAGDFKYADLQYVDPLNQVVNTASYAAGAWQVSASVFNADGNVERSYDARAVRAIDAAASSPANVSDGVVRSHQDHASLNVYWSDLSLFIDENGDGISTASDPVVNAEEKARNQATAAFVRGFITDTYSPVTTDENNTPARVHTQSTFTPLTEVDAGGMPRMLVSKAVTSRANSGVIDPSVAGESVIAEVRNGYDAFSVDKNGRAITDKTNVRSGWVVGSPTTVTQVMEAPSSNIVVETRFDDQGRVSETRQPSSTGADAGTTRNIYYTAGPNSIDAACGNRPEYAGYVCKNTPQGGGSVTKHQTGFNLYGQPATFTETSTGTDGAQRTTTQTYRADGQELKTTVTTSGVTTVAVAPVEKLYDAKGVHHGVRALAVGSTPQSEVTWTQDLWGRTISYTNSLGETTTTEYDGFGNVTKTVSPVSTRTFRYGALSGDGDQEYQGVVTSMTVSDHGGPGSTGTYTATYDGDGNLISQTMPGGFSQHTDYDASGKQVRLAYDGPLTAADGTTSTGTWVAWELKRDTIGRIVGEATPEGDVLTGTSLGGTRGAAYDREFTYDRASRLTKVQDTTAAPGETINTDPGVGAVTAATVREYVFDRNGNRTHLKTSVDGTLTSTRSWTYDSADRIGVGAGYVYDGLGRQTLIPATDAPASTGTVTAGDGPINVSYYADDAAAAISRGGTTTNIGRDPAGRRLTLASTTGTSAAGTETKHYTDATDNPGWTSRVHGTQTLTTRYEATIGGDLALTITNHQVELALNNPHGDVVATVPLTGTTAGHGITGWAQYDEYGNPKTANSVNTGATSYGWHGADQRALDTSGLILMGARLYNPTTGHFTTRDPIPGGNTTTYTYPQNPITMNDTTGKSWDWADVFAGISDATGLIPGPHSAVVSSGTGIIASWIYSSTRRPDKARGRLAATIAGVFIPKYAGVFLRGASGRLRAVGGVVDGVRGYLYSNAVQTAFEGSRKARNPRKGSGKWYKSQVRKIQSIKPKIRSYRAYAF